MYQFFRDGGWSMFVIMVLGMFTLGATGFYAVRPDGRREGFLLWVSRAMLWSILAGVASDIGATCHATSAMRDADERSRAVMQGLAESMSPAIMGFALLAVTAFLTAVGHRRLDARPR